MVKWSVVAVYVLALAGITAANLLVNHYGPSSTPYVAFALIGLDIAARDRLHLNVHGIYRWLTIGSLIVCGSVITYLVNQNAGDVALASVCAFAAAMVVDSLVFEAARPLDAHRRVNLSNVFAAATDTLIFFWLAFPGPLSLIPFALIFGQWTAKVAGGAIWGFLLVRETDALYEPDVEWDRA